MVELYSPRPEDQLTFGLWTAGNVGRDPSRELLQPPLSRRLEKPGGQGTR